MSDNPRYILYGAKYSAVVANNASAEPIAPITIAGKCCESGDLIQENIMIPEVKVGDTLAVLATGAYNYSMASNYNRIPRHAVLERFITLNVIFCHVLQTAIFRHFDTCLLCVFSVILGHFCALTVQIVHKYKKPSTRDILLFRLYLCYCNFSIKILIYKFEKFIYLFDFTKRKLHSRPFWSEPYLRINQTSIILCLDVVLSINHLYFFIKLIPQSSQF